MEAVLSAVCAQYGLGEATRVSTAPPGTAARAWYFSAQGRPWVLRELTGPAQGEREVRLTCALRAQGFSDTPEILRTLQGAGAALADGQWYQVQRYCTGERPAPEAPGTAAAVGRCAGRLEAALAKCAPEPDVPERFPLEALWAQAAPRWAALDLGLTCAAAEAAVQAVLERPLGRVQMIHGDLGLWNLRQSASGRIYVIDFGDARMGSASYDAACALGGLLNHTGEAALWPGLLTDFLAGYAAGHGSPLETAALRLALEHWYWRCILEAVVTARIPEKRRRETLRHFLAARQYLRAALDSGEGRT